MILSELARGGVGGPPRLFGQTAKSITQWERERRARATDDDPAAGFGVGQRHRHGPETKHDQREKAHRKSELDCGD